MQYLTSILISLIILSGIIFGVANYATLNNLSSLSVNKEFGSTLTTITGSTKIKDLGTILPANFNALNTDKLETSSYYATTTHSVITSIPNLETIGTITSGTWNATKLTVTYGGTGSSSLSSNQVLLGNGTGAIQSIGFGSNGQFLTSAGAGTLPSWTSASVNTASDYTWTGTHIFSATSSFSLFPSIPTGTPTNGASAISIGYATSTFGLLTNGLSSKEATSTDFSITGAGGAEYGTSTMWAIPANTLTGKKLIKIKLFGSSAHASGKIDVKLNNTVVGTLTLASISGSLEIYLFAANSSSAQSATIEEERTTPYYSSSDVTTSVDMTAAVNLNAVLYTGGASQATTLLMYSIEFVNN